PRTAGRRAARPVSKGRAAAPAGYRALRAGLSSRSAPPPGGGEDSARKVPAPRRGPGRRCVRGSPRAHSTEPAMRTILSAALLVLAAGAVQAQDLSATFTALAQGAQAQAAARTADAQSLRAVLDRLLTGLGTRASAPNPG